MAEKFRFMDPVQLPDGTYDREYNAQEFTDYFKALVTTGVMKSVGNQLAVSANGANMVTRIDTGLAFILGRYYENDSFKEHTHDTETLGNSRIDRIVVRMDLSPDKRSVLSYIKKGVPSANPVAPALTQTPNLYEISLAQVKIVGGQTFIAANAVTNERGKDVVCPWAGSNILPSFDDNALAEHLEDDKRHLTASDIDKLNDLQKYIYANGTRLSTEVDLDTLKEGLYYTTSWADTQKLINRPQPTYPRTNVLIRVYSSSNNSVIQEYTFMTNALSPMRNASLYSRTRDGSFAPWVITPKIEPSVLLTNEKYDLNAIINELFTSVSEGKADNRSALAQMGVTVPVNPTFAQISAGIKSIKTGKKYAEGTAISVTNRPSYVASWIKLTGLGFTPRAVIAKRVGTADTEWFSVYGSLPSVTNNLKLYKTTGALYNSGGSGGNSSEFWVETGDNGGIAYEYITYE